MPNPDPASKFTQFLEAAKLVPTDFAYEAVDGWTKLLRSAAERGDGELEGLIAERLLAGWQAGNQFLLPAAIKVFAWTEKAPCEQLAQAAAEYETLMAGPLAEDRYQQLKTLQQLRSGSIPPKAKLERELVHAQRVEALYPALLPLIADAYLLQRWRLRFTEQHGKPADAAAETRLARLFTSHTIGSIGVYAMLVILMLFVVSGIVMMRKEPVPIALVGQLRPGVHLAEPLVREISSRIQFHTPIGQLNLAVFRVTLDDNGAVKTTEMIRASGTSDFDRAAYDAIRGSRPFPATAPRQFELELGQLGNASRSR